MRPWTALWACYAASAVSATQNVPVSRSVALPASVKLSAVANSSETVVLRAALKRQNLEQLESTLKTVSDPSHSDYGKYKSSAEIASLFGHSNESEKAVKDWLKQAGIENVDTKGSLVRFETTVGKANDLLSANFSWFDVGGSQKLRSTKYTLPAAMAEHIDVVSPTTYFGRGEKTTLHRRATVEEGDISRRAQEESNCSQVITPACLEEAYNYGDYEIAPSSGSRVGFASFLEQSAQRRDLTRFLKIFDLPEVNFTTELFNNGEDRQGALGNTSEANLDVQLLAAVTKGLPLKQYITGGLGPLVPNLRQPDEASNQNEPFLEYYEALMAMDNDELPQVISHSYADDEQTVPKEYAIRICRLIGMMGLRGVTILGASGDSGVGAACRANDGSGKEEFTPLFPSTCPYVTTVGGTQDWDPEVAWKASSGGFSNYFSRAWYQEDAVKKYLSEHISAETKSYYENNDYVDFAGRGFPDVAAHSLSPNYFIIDQGIEGLSGGTSASCPVFAGIVGLLNDARLRAGKPVMGFMNPWLYSAEGAKSLKDVTQGMALGCYGVDLQRDEPIEGAGIIQYASWNATTGWDPVTGLGIPDFEKMRKAAMNDD